HGPARKRGESDEADCDRVGGVRMPPDSLYEFDDAGLCNGAGKRHDSLPRAAPAPSISNRSAIDNGSNPMATGPGVCRNARRTSHPRFLVLASLNSNDCAHRGGGIRATQISDQTPFPLAGDA